MSRYDRQTTQTGCMAALVGVILIVIGAWVGWNFTPSVNEIVNGSGRETSPGAIIGIGLALFGAFLLMAGNAINPNNH